MKEGTAFFFVVLILSAKCHENITVVSPAIINEVPTAILYEDTVSLALTANLTVFEKPSNETAPEIRDLINLMIDELNSPWNDADVPAVRSRRELVTAAIILGGIAIGAIIGFVGTYYSARSVDKFMHETKDTVDKYQQDLVLMNSTLSGYGTDISQFLEASLNREKRFNADVIRLLEVKIGFDIIMDARETCLLGRIPPSFVSAAELLKNLKELDSRLQRDGKTLAFPLSDFMFLYKERIAACAFTSDMITVIISVPIKHVQRNWELVEVIPVRFAFSGETCMLLPSEPKLVARSENKTVTISTSLLPRCHLSQSQLCLVTQFSIDASADDYCTTAMASHKTLMDMSKYCTFACVKSQELTVQQVTADQIVATNVDTVQSVCPSNVTQATYPRIGALTITPKCNCTIVLNGHFVIEPPLFCKVYFNQKHVVHGVPSMWLQFRHALGSHSHNMSAVDYRWPERIPVLNLSRIHTHATPEVPDIFTQNLLTVGLGINSSVVLTIIIVIGLLVCLYRHGV